MRRAYAGSGDLEIYEDEPGDVWQIDYDWDGKETGRTLLGTIKTTEEAARYTHEGKYKAVQCSKYYLKSGGLQISRGDLTGPDSLIKAEKTDSGIRVTDLEGNSLGTIRTEYPLECSVIINGKMIEIINHKTFKYTWFIVWND